MRRHPRAKRGMISLVTVFAVLLLAMLLALVINVGRQLDARSRQNHAADAAALSSGAVLARGMNGVAFMNHLLCDTLALTAFLREARDQNARSLTPEILAAWTRVGDVFSKARLPKLQALGRAIHEKVKAEQLAIDRHRDWARAVAAVALPTLERILAEELIPNYQRELIRTTPTLAQAAAQVIATRHDSSSNGPPALSAVLWRTCVDPVGGASETIRSTIPAVDPFHDSGPYAEHYKDAAKESRALFARKYLDAWNSASLAIFDHQCKMSNYGALWRGFTSGQLDRLLETEHRLTNMPHLLRSDFQPITDVNRYIERDYSFIAVVGRTPVKPILPGLFPESLDTDPTSVTQIELFIPKRRLVWSSPRRPEPPERFGGRDAVGVVGDFVPFPGAPDPFETPPPAPQGAVVRDNAPIHWDLWNQHWTVRLVPARAPSIVEIMSKSAPIKGGVAARPPRLTPLGRRDLELLLTR